MRDGKGCLLVGSYAPPNLDGGLEVIKREFYGQGMIFKSDEAFYDFEHPDRVCYIPELSDTKYTRNMILQECNGQTDLAEEVYEALDWQHVSSLLEELRIGGELETCQKCGKMFNCHDATTCPYCMAEMDDAAYG